MSLEDSGAEVCVVREDLVRDPDAPSLGKIRIRGTVGDSVETDLIRLNIKPAPCTNSVDVNCVEYSHNIAPFIPVIFAVCDKTIDGQDIILTADAVDQLNQLSDYDACVQLAVASLTDSGGGEFGPVSLVSSSKVEGVVVSSPSVDDSKAEECAGVDTLYQEQVDDPALQPRWKLAEQKKGNFFIKNRLLYYHEKILGHNVEQLYLPSSRLLPVLKLDHDAHFRGHYAFKTIMKRIQLSFYFPNMTQTIKDYCASCHDYQLRARELVKDRTPITPIPRNEIPFSHLWWDCIGPLLDPNETSKLLLDNM